MTAADTYLDLFGRGLRLRVDADGWLIVSPGELLTDDDRAAIRQYRDELKAIVNYVAIPAMPLEPGRTHAIPSGCVGPTACRALGVCGRLACMSDAERGAFAVAVFNARAARTPYPVTRLVDPLDISRELATKKDDHAAAA